MTMLAVVPLSDHPLFLWQMVVHWAWQEEVGLPTRYLVYTDRNGERSPQLAAILDMMKDRKTIATATVFPDWRVNPQYHPAMKPGLIGKWLTTEPAFVDRPVLLLDPDALPLPQFARAAETFHPTATRWFGTDTDHYTGPTYLKAKGEDLWVRLCALVGVNPEMAATIPGCGAQWVFTGQHGALWSEIAALSEKAYLMLVGHRSDVQTWCAEMYITQLVLAREGIESERCESMQMVWAGDHRDGWTKAGFYHNAGVVEPGTGHFHKGSWADKAPFYDPHDYVASDSASFRYVDAIRHAEKTFPNLCDILTQQNG